MAKPKKIILANNDLSDIEMTKQAFQRTALPLDVEPVNDGEELLNYLRKEYLGNIALVLLDLNLPKISGIEILKVMYNDDELKKLPVIIFSSSFEKDIIMQCYEHGANAYVVRPTEMEELENTINAIGNFWGEINVLPSYNGHEVL